MAREELTRLNGNGTCGEDDCPNVYRTGSGSVAQASADGLALGLSRYAETVGSPAR